MRHSARHAGFALGLAMGLLATGCGGGSSEWEGGIHARMGWSEGGGLRVVEVPPGGPAAEAGLAVGDVIVSIDGVALGDRSVREVVDMLRGPVGTSAELEVRRDGDRRIVSVDRAPYAEPDD